MKKTDNEPYRRQAKELRRLIRNQPSAVTEIWAALTSVEGAVTEQSLVRLANAPFNEWRALFNVVSDSLPPAAVKCWYWGLGGLSKDLSRVQLARHFWKAMNAK